MKNQSPNLRTGNNQSNLNSQAKNSNLENKIDQSKIKTALSENTKDKRKAQRHNKILKEKYSHLQIPEINSGCCPVCGEYHCENEFCKEHNFQQLIGFVNHLGFNPIVLGTNKIFGEFERVREMIRNLYWDKKLSILELGKLFNYKDGDIFVMPVSVLNNLNIPRRNFSDAQSIALLENRKDIPGSNVLNNNQGWHKTWTGDEMFLRSSYEFDYAKELDNNKIRYEVEDIRIEYTDTILNQIRIAIPDFYLPDTNEIVEIKSDFTLDIQEMLDKFDAYKKLGYNVKLILEHEEIDLYNIENLISKERLKRIKTKNIKILKIKDTNNNNTD